MKRLFIIMVCACICAPGIYAHDYQHSVGGTVGSMNGVSYKGFFKPIGANGAIGLVGDLGVHLVATGYVSHGMLGEELNRYETASFFTFEANPNVVYQSEIAEFDTGRVDWFAGIGTSLGLMSGFDTRNGSVNGKFGMNVIGGAEVVFDVPVNLSLDFRPGYGLTFAENAGMSYFDWGIVASVRYRF